jgi:enoyl-CoA hydratase
MSLKQQFECGGHVALLTLDRPAARNAIDPEMRAALAEAFAKFEADDNIWATVLAGTPPAFCAGADLKAIQAGRADDLSDEHGFASVTSRTRSKPLIAAVSGPALAGGTEIVLACDLVVAERNATFGLPEVKRSLVAAAGGLYRLPRVMPRNIALECLLTGDPITADRAAAYGLVNILCEDGTGVASALELASRICANAPLAVRESLRLSLASAHLDDTAAQRASSQAMRRVLASADAAEGLQAFIEKRPPVWRGA